MTNMIYDMGDGTDMSMEKRLTGKAEGLELEGLSDNEAFLQRLFYRHVGSAVLSMFGAMASLMANSLLAGIFFGTEGLAVMSVVAPLYLLFSALGSLAGAGGSTAAAHALGRDDRDGANEAFTFSLLLGIGFPLAGAVLLYLGLDGILEACGCAAELHDDAYRYSLPYLMGGFGVTLFYLPYNFLRLLGKLRALVGLFLGMAVLNILLDIGCVKVLGMGLSGIAVGTVAAAIVTAGFGIWLLLRGETRFSLIRPRSVAAVRSLLQLGMPPALNNLLNFLRLLLMNRIIVAVAGSSGLAAFSVLTALENLSLVVLSGLAQATAGFVSVFTKEMDTVSVRRIQKYAMALGLLLMAPLAILLLVFPGEVCRLFGLRDTVDLSLATRGAYVFAFSLLPSVPCFLLSFYYQAAGFPMLSNFMIFCRSFLFIILPAWLLSSAYGLEGVWWSFLLASVCPLLLAAAVPYFYRRGYDGILLQDLRAEREGRYISFAVPADAAAIVAEVDRLEGFCAGNGLPRQEVMLLRLSLEEMLLSIKEHCFPSDASASMDVRILILRTQAAAMTILRIRNGGKLFNPIDYYERLRADDPLALEDALGIAMILRAAGAVHYKSTFGINNLTVIIDQKRTNNAKE